MHTRGVFHILKLDDKVNMKKSPSEKSELENALLVFKKSHYSIGVFSFFVNFLMLTPSIYMLQVYDRVLNSRNETTLLMLTLIVLGLYLLMGLLESVRSAILIRMGAKFDMNLAGRVFDSVFEFGLRVRSGGNPNQALHDLATLRQFLSSTALVVLFDLIWLPIFLLAAFMFDPLLGYFLFVGALILFGLAYATEIMTRGPLVEANAIAIKAAAYTNNNLRNVEVIESMGMLTALKQRWLEMEKKILVLQGKASDKAALINAITKFTRMGLQSLMLGLGALLALQGKITPGMMIAATILMGRALSPVEQVIATWKQFVTARGAYKRLEELLNAYPQREAGMALPRPTGVLAVENVFAAVPGTQIAILRGINFSLSAGEVLGVIGPSASGKSSLARLLVGVWSAQNGKVRLDGADVYQWNKADLGPHVGYLPQDIELFDGTIAENIARFGDLDADRIVAAAKLAGVHDLILHFPKGYDSPIGTGGDMLSGGQKQRIALARALYGDPCLLVLDEPNSNLDDAGEVALANAIKALKEKGKTVVLITHRTNLIGLADKMLVLRDGAQQLFGPRDQVIAALTQAMQAAQKT